jgi:hypothetical protein
MIGCGCPRLAFVSLVIGIESGARPATVDHFSQKDALPFIKWDGNRNADAKPTPYEFLERA